jgi:predicted HTH transcriptional regulator
MDHGKIKKLLESEESTKLDFKATLKLDTESAKKELAKDVIAIANSRGGRGYILFGIEDKTKKVLGIGDTDFNEEKVQQIIYNRCDPPIAVSLEKVKYRNKSLAALTIYRSNQKPHQMIQNGSFYIRRGSTTDVAKREEIANMFQEYGLLSFENIVLYNVSTSELDFNLINKFFSDDITLLEGIGIIGKDSESEEYHPTLGGMLLFGKNPIIFLPYVYVEIEIRDQVKLFSGNVFKLLNTIEEYIGSICDQDDYPLEALYEVIVNAIIHRDYLDHSNGIRITISEEFIEIVNPGSLLQDSRKYNLGRDNIPKRRNPWLYQKLLMIDKNKTFFKYRIGLKGIKNLYKDKGRVKFINLGNKNIFKTIVPGFKINIENV